MRFYFSIILLGFILLFACEDDDMAGPMVPATINFGGVVLTDVNGNPIGGGDASDWNLNEDWTDQVFSLFNDEKRDLCSDVSESRAFGAYPNPAIGQIILPYDLQDSTDLQLRIVDRDYTLLKEIEVGNVFGPGFNQAAIRLDDLNITDTVRFYYKLIGKNCEFRGHGDVIITQ